MNRSRASTQCVPKLELGNEKIGTPIAPLSSRSHFSGVHPMEAAALVLGLAALGGVTMAGIRLSGTPLPPTWLALGHGGIAAVGLVLLIQAVLTTTVPTMAQVALGIFVLAALGGATMFIGFHMREKALPI